MWVANLSGVWKYCICLSNHFKKPISILVNLLGDFLPELPLISTFTSCQELASLKPTKNIIQDYEKPPKMSKKYGIRIIIKLLWRSQKALNLVWMMFESCLSVCLLDIRCCVRWFNSPGIWDFQVLNNLEAWNMQLLHSITYTPHPHSCPSFSQETTTKHIFRYHHEEFAFYYLFRKKKCFLLNNYRLQHNVLGRTKKT